MNWTELEGKWREFRGQVKSKWAKLTDDDLGMLEGKKDQLVGKIVQRYGIAKDEAERQLDAWVTTLGDRSHEPREQTRR